VINHGAAATSAGPGETEFLGSATAGQASFTNNGGRASGASGGRLRFRHSSTASNATIKNNGGAVSGAFEAVTSFQDSSSGGSATIIANGSSIGGAFGSFISFQFNSTADNATLIANSGELGGEGGKIRFSENADGWTAQVQVFGSGNLAISAQNTPGVTIGSLEGSGIVYLGARNLTVGSNNMSKTFSGVMVDGGYPGEPGGTGGSLTKIGSGTLTLSGTNFYTGATTIEAGKLILDGFIASVARGKRRDPRRVGDGRRDHGKQPRHAFARGQRRYSQCSWQSHADLGLDLFG